MFRELTSNPTIMADIFHTFTINSSPEKIFECFCTPGGLDNWWTKKSEGKPGKGSIYTLDFGPGYLWKAKVTICEPGKAFEWVMTEAESDWVGTRIGFVLENMGENKTSVSFYHTGWPSLTENFRVSNYCWAMYLRILKRYAEYGEQVTYEKRLSV